MLGTLAKLAIPAAAVALPLIPKLIGLFKKKDDKDKGNDQMQGLLGILQSMKGLQGIPQLPGIPQIPGITQPPAAQTVVQQAAQVPQVPQTPQAQENIGIAQLLGLLEQLKGIQGGWNPEEIEFGDSLRVWRGSKGREIPNVHHSFQHSKVNVQINLYKKQS